MGKHTKYQKIGGGKMWIFFYLRKSDFWVIKYRFSHDRYQIRVRNFKIRIRGQKLPIHYKIRHLTTKGRFWSNFLVRYLVILVARTRQRKENTRVHFGAKSPVDKFRVFACFG